MWLAPNNSSPGHPLTSRGVSRYTADPYGQKKLILGKNNRVPSLLHHIISIVAQLMVS
jgi:hypothetical protein